MSTPLFSIIIPSFNAGASLKQCLDSIAVQTESEYEVLIIDNCSTDDSSAIAREYKSKIPRLKWISERDNGIYSAMNKGLALATFDWIYFLGTDDRLYDPFVLENMKRFININKECMVFYGNVESILFNGIYCGEFSKEKLFNQNICHQAIFINKSVFKKLGTFNERYKAFADWDHNLKWFMSPSIQKRYVDLVIARYGAEGFSSLSWDSVFGNEKQFNYLLYGCKVLPFSYRASMLGKEFIKLARLKKVKRLLKLLLNAPFILIPIF